VCPSRPAGTDPGEARSGSEGSIGLRCTKLFDGEACAKGTALVAKALEDAMRILGRNALARGGSSGGRARGTSNDRTRAASLAQKNPRSGADRREACREIGCG
jgi:hypothetical protein